jgi:hypothetical protein
MKIISYNYPHSSFLSVEKDLDIIIDYFLKNERLKKLLYYTTPDALDKSNIGEDATFELFGKNIKIVPQLSIDGSVLNYIIITFDNFTPNAENPEFRDNIIMFDIVCNYEQWNLKGTSLRPIKIAAEIDSMFNGKRLTGIGKLEFMGANNLILNENYAGICLMYNAIHGEEDKKNANDPKEEIDLDLNFD